MVHWNIYHQTVLRLQYYKEAPLPYSTLNHQHTCFQQLHWWFGENTRASMCSDTINAIVEA
jgi:hypothetical protein